jgi:hypothetical protein
MQSFESDLSGPGWPGILESNHNKDFLNTDKYNFKWGIKNE